MIIGITGITSGLGKRLAEILSEKKYKIKALIRETSDVNNLPKNIDYIYGDLSNVEALKKLINNIDICIHIAAQVSHTSYKNYYEVNVKGTNNICKTILEINPDCRIIHCSTISTLKVNPFFKIKSSNYAISKYYGEKIVIKYSKNNNLKYTIIYPGLIYGKYDKTLLPQAIKLIKYNMIKLIKGGEKKVPLIYVDDLCDLFIKVIENKKSINKRYISVKGLDIGVHDFFKILADKLGFTISKKTYNKIPLFIFAIIQEIIYKIFKKDKNPIITRTYVDIMSINMKNYKKKYDDPKTDLNWEQNVTKEYLINNINNLIKHYIDK